MAVRKRLRDYKTSARICERRAGSAWMYKTITRGNANREIGKAWKAKRSRETCAHRGWESVRIEKSTMQESRYLSIKSVVHRRAWIVSRVYFRGREYLVTNFFFPNRTTNTSVTAGWSRLFPRSVQRLRHSRAPLRKSTTYFRHRVKRNISKRKRKKNKHRGTAIIVWPSRL